MTAPSDENKPRGALASQLDLLVGDVETTTASYFLVGLSGRYAGKLFRLAEGEWIIGRAQDALIQLGEKAVSHRHAKLTMRAGQCILVDLESTNGTFVNDVGISGPVELHAGDVIRIGTANFGYLTEGDDDVQHTRALARVSTGLADASITNHTGHGDLLLAPASLAPASGAPSNGIDAALDKVVLALRFLRTYWKGLVLSSAVLALIGACTIFVRPPMAKAEFLISLRHQAGEVNHHGRFVAQVADYFRYPEVTFTSPELVRSTMKSFDLPTQPSEVVLKMARSLTLYSEMQGVYRGSFYHADVDLAERFLAVHLQNYLEGEITKALKVLSSEVDLLRKQYEDNEAKLRATEKQLKEFKETHLAGLPENATAQLETRAELHTRSLELQANLDRYTRELELLRKQYASGDAIITGQVEKSQPHSSALATTRQQLAAARSQGLKDSHPEVERLLKQERELAALEQKSITSEVTEIDRRANRDNATLLGRIGQLEVLVNSTRKELGLVSGRLGELDKVAALMPGVEAEFAELTRSLTLSQNLHQHLFEQLKAKELKLEFERASVAGRYELLEPLTAEPSRPARTAMLRAGIGGVAGLVFATVGSILHLLIAYARRRHQQGAQSPSMLPPALP